MYVIRFSDHTLLKLEILKAHGLPLDMELTQNVIAKPEQLMKGYHGRKIAQKGLDLNHVLRVVYEEHHDEIVVITFYPGRRERYDKD
ncbi:MAG: DUF4258 domain-containing protein [Chloroflexi bacterium]|nr:DUF4258 domain-containing protein [Chloroflexota bacterium]